VVDIAGTRWVDSETSIAVGGGGGWPGGRKCRGDCGVSQRGGFGKLVLYCFRGFWWEGMGRAQSPTVPEGRRVVWPKCNFSQKPYREGLSRLDFRRRCRRSRTNVVCRGGERWWCDGRVEDVDATTQNRAKSKKEQTETEHRDAYTRVHKANVPLEQTQAKSVVFWWT
jgi:hypothetical protein